MGRTKKVNPALPANTRKLRSRTATRTDESLPSNEHVDLQVGKSRIGRKGRKPVKYADTASSSVDTQSQLNKQEETTKQDIIQSSSVEDQSPAKQFSEAVIEEDEDITIQNWWLKSNAANSEGNGEGIVDSGRTNIGDPKESDAVSHIFVKKMDSNLECEEERRKEDGKEDEIAITEELYIVENSNEKIVDSGSKVEAQVGAENRDADDVDVEIIRDDSPSFSPPPTPPKSVETVKAVNQPCNNKIPMMLSNASSLSTLEIKSLNVDTQFTLAKPDASLKTKTSEAFGVQPDDCQVTSISLGNVSVADEPLDYVEEVRMNDSVQLMSPDEHSKFDQALKKDLTPVRASQTQAPTSMLCKEDLIIDSSFWIDQIKSHCFVAYESTEAAVRARVRLHGLCWPSGSPKKLEVDFSTAAESFQNKSKPLQDYSRHRNNEVQMLTFVDQAKANKIDTPVNVPVKKLPIREWDIPKLEKHKLIEEDKNSCRQENFDAKRTAKEIKKKEGRKLLDDLFHKTNTKPCIYWLALTEDQVRRKRREDEYQRQGTVLPLKRMHESRSTKTSRRSPRPPTRPARRKYYDERIRRRVNIGNIDTCFICNISL
ncbi:hypothetical protein GJ496_006287 [Pomphorhynchus laevis]|nr:hypothetical protein GJ496_006287 [Pomphorhynchus laevis]